MPVTHASCALLPLHGMQPVGIDSTSRPGVPPERLLLASCGPCSRARYVYAHMRGGRDGSNEYRHVHALDGAVVDGAVSMILCARTMPTNAGGSVINAKLDGTVEPHFFCSTHEGCPFIPRGRIGVFVSMVNLIPLKGFF